MMFSLYPLVLVVWSLVLAGVYCGGLVGCCGIWFGWGVQVLWFDCPEDCQAFAGYLFHFEG
jgi:hypothetical protein